jgi:hypothetical protein
MVREIICKTNDKENECKTAFLNICGKDDFMCFLLSIILDGADFLHTTGSSLWNDIKKKLDGYFPTYVDDKKESKLVFTFECTKGKKHGDKFDINVLGENLNDNGNDELNVLYAFIGLLIKKGVPVETVLKAISEAIDEYCPAIDITDDCTEESPCADCPVYGADTNRCTSCEKAPKKHINEDTENIAVNECDKETCADCENCCEKSTEVKASEDIPCTPYGAEAKDCGECQPEYKGEIGDIRSTGDNGDDITLMSADKP